RESPTAMSRCAGRWRNGSSTRSTRTRPTQSEGRRQGARSPPLNVHANRIEPMLIGAHVSTAGGLDKAIERGTELGCESIQIFNQSPRMWRPTKYGEEDFARFREAMDGSPVEAVVIHAVYLIN